MSVFLNALLTVTVVMTWTQPPQTIGITEISKYRLYCGDSQSTLVLRDEWNPVNSGVRTYTNTFPAGDYVCSLRTVTVQAPDQESADSNLATFTIPALVLEPITDLNMTVTVE